MNTHQTMAALSIVTMALLPMAACDHSDRGGAAVPGTTAYREYRVGVTNPQAPIFDERIVEQLSVARCDREQSCGNVGADRRYVAKDVCMNQMRGSIGDDLNASRCPLGIDRQALDQCLSAIGDEGCGDGVAILNRARKCRSSALCLR
jgi:hypothetical protein